MGDRRWLLALVVVVMLAAVWVPQWWVYDKEATRRVVDNTVAAQQVSALEVTELKVGEFSEQERLLAAKLRLLEPSIPARMDVDDFVTEYCALCTSLGFEAFHPGIQEREAEQYREASLVMALIGDQTRMPELRERTEQMTRLVGWRPSGQWDRGPVVALTLYSRPSPRGQWQPGPCAPEHYPNVMWPFSRRLAALERERTRLCQAINTHAETVQRITAFQADRRMLEAHVALIESLRGKNTLVQTPAP